MGGTGSRELSPDEVEYKAAVNHRAIEKGIIKNDISTFYYPIHQGADPNRRNDKGESLIELAIKLQRVECVGFLCSMPEVDLKAATSSGISPLKLAERLHKEAQNDTDEDKELAAEAIAELLAKPEEKGNLFRRAYDMHIDKLLKQEEMRKQRNFGLYFIAFVFMIHSVGVAFPDSDTADLLSFSPLFNFMMAVKRLIAPYCAQAIGLLGLAGKDEL
jgi:hypothetical protein